MTRGDSPAGNELGLRERIAASRRVTTVRDRLQRHSFALGSVVVVVVAAFAYDARHHALWGPNAPLMSTGDEAGTAALLQSAARAPLLGFDTHLANGAFSHWSHPQLGLFNALLMKTSGMFDLTAQELMYVAIIANVALVSWTCFVAATPFLRSRVSAMILAIVLAISPYCLIRASGHLNVMACYLPFAALAAIATRSRHRQLLVLTLVMGVLAPPWWQASTAVCVGAVALLALIAQQRDTVIRSVQTGAMLIPGIVLTILIHAKFAISGAVPTRGPWESNVYGGHFLDLVANAPVVERVPGINRSELAPGLSLESPGFGSVALIFIVIALAFSMYRVASSRQHDAPRTAAVDAVDDRVLHVLAVAVVATFATGGFGNLQAGVAVILGGESPARVWSRFSILVAFIAGIYALRAISAAPRILGCTLLVVIVAISVADYHLTDTRHVSQPRAATNFGLTPSLVKRLSTADCVIVQVPLGAFPIPRGPVHTKKFVTHFYYDDLRPYLTYPQLKWTAGVPLRKSGQPMLNHELEAIREHPTSKYCGYLIDWDYYRLLEEKGKLSETELSIGESAPETADRYEFVPLNRAATDSSSSRPRGSSS